MRGLCLEICWEKRAELFSHVVNRKYSRCQRWCQALCSACCGLPIVPCDSSCGLIKGLGVFGPQCPSSLAYYNILTIVHWNRKLVRHLQILAISIKQHYLHGHHYHYHEYRKSSTNYCVYIIYCSVLMLHICATTLCDSLRHVLSELWTLLLTTYETVLLFRYRLSICICASNWIPLLSNTRRHTWERKSRYECWIDFFFNL